MAYSNVPGLLAPVNILETQVQGLASLVTPSGKAGMCVSIISFVDEVRVSSTCDSSVMEKTKQD